MRIVLVGVFRGVELPAARHDVSLRRRAMRGVGIQIDAHGVGIEATEIDLDADVVSRFSRYHTEGAGACVGRVVCEVGCPADQHRAEGGVVSPSRPIHRGGRHVIRIRVSGTTRLVENRAVTRDMLARVFEIHAAGIPSPSRA